MKRERRKIPRKALEPLMETCEWLGREREKPSKDIFKRYLGLMNKYASYFFSEPWPKKYDHDEATSFTDEDLDFLVESDEEFGERFEVMCLKKNLYLEGFMGYFGMFWTKQGFYEEFIRPGLKSIVEAFEKFAEKDEDARSVLNKLKEQFEVRLIHNGLVDLVEHEYLDKAEQMLVAGMFELMHTEEGLPPCGKYRCELQRKMLNKNQDKSANV